MGEVTKPKQVNALLPDRYPQLDLFLCDVVDAVLKSDIESMAHPVFALSTSPNMKPVRYCNGDNYLQVTPSAHGRATIHDRDVLIYCISQAMHALNNNQKVSKRIRFRAGDILMATNRQRSGRGYQLLKNSFRRLQGTQIETNIRRDGQEQFKVFGLLESAQVIRETSTGRMIEVEVILSDWIFDAIEDHHVLTLDRTYYRLRRPLERRLYEIARKFCGSQKSWQIGLEKLRERCGSESSLREFRRLVKRIVTDDAKLNYMPQYKYSFEGDKLLVRNTQWSEPRTAAVAPMDAAPLSPGVMAEARRAAPGWDVYALENEWRAWVRKRKIAVKHSDRHFVSFCRARGPCLH